MADPQILEVGDDGFYQHVLLRSHEIPVVVDFWAPWCGPCRQLAPVLERVYAEHADETVLVKVNTDESPAVARQYEVQSIPLVVGFRDGQPVDQFLGLQPEAAVRAFFRGLAPSKADLAAAEGSRLASAGDIGAAEARYREALEADAQHGAARLGLAGALAARGETDEALRELERVTGDAALEGEAARLAASLRMRDASGTDSDELRARIEANPGDLRARIELGRALAAAGEHEPALEVLVEAVRRDAAFDDGAARRAMLDIFEVLGGEDLLTRKFRRELGRVLFH